MNRQALVMAAALVSIIIGGYYFYWQQTRPSYWQESERLYNEVLDPDHAKNTEQMHKDVTKARRTDPNKREFTMDDVERDRAAVMPSMRRSAEIDQVGKEAEAVLKGEALPHPPRYLKGFQASWLATNIPIYNSCVHITAKGEITRDPYTHAGPNGINLDALENQERAGYLQIHSQRTTLLRGVPWGAFSGKVCADSKGLACGPSFPIGESAYLNTRLTGAAGHLWVIPNGFVSSSSAGLISGIPTLNMSDYNSYRGGFRFDQDSQAAPDYLCQPRPASGYLLTANTK